MRQFKLMIATLILIVPFFLSAQSPVGDWTYDMPQADGTTVTVKLTFEDNGKMKVDVGNDGTIDIHYTYTFDETKISIKETSSGGYCYGVTGVYGIARIKGNPNTKMYAIDDPCEARKAIHDGIKVTRVE